MMAMNSTLNSYINFSIDGNGWLQSDVQPCRHLPSPNFDQRPANIDIDLLVIHCIALPPEQYGTGEIDNLFTNHLDPNKHPYFKGIHELRVSSHLLIDRQGYLTQYVSFLDRAWHCGISHWQGRDQCNDFAIGIELEGTDNSHYTDEQYQCLTAVTKILLATYPSISHQRIVAHSDIAPGRKTDPGSGFDWSRYLSSL